MVFTTVLSRGEPAFLGLVFSSVGLITYVVGIWKDSFLATGQERFSSHNWEKIQPYMVFTTVLSSGELALMALV